MSSLRKCRFIAADAGTGPFVVGDPIAGYVFPEAAGAVVGVVYKYNAFYGDEYEAGEGLYTLTGLERGLVLASSSDDFAVDFAVPPVVEMTEPAPVVLAEGDNSWLGANTFLGPVTFQATATFMQTTTFVQRATFEAGLTTTQVNVGAQQVIGARKTGWGVPTGTLERTSYTTYVAGGASADYNATQISDLMTHVQTLSNRLAALIADMNAHGAIGT
jgi:hypothetical protein